MDQCWNREAKALKAAGDHPIRFKHLYAVEKFQDHQRLLHLKGLDDTKNDLFFVGYQAQGTPGRAIMEGCTPPLEK
ncbi:MAG: hypothetical protein K9K40_08650 [Desulfotignum sp.]|nr:hypothetical protein [Desulfotignum sp.]MCF8125729.1 hypothetical protein [Desulfotignum sp.]